MSKLKELKKEYEMLREEYFKVSDYMNSIGKKIKVKKYQIKEIEELIAMNYVKYNNKVYHIRYEELSYKKNSMLFKDTRNGNFIIIINSRLSKEERKKELHIILKEKKQLKKYTEKGGLVKC